MKTQFRKRIESFLWRGGAISVIAFIGFVTENISDFNFPEYAVVVIGLFLGEITKYLNANKLT